MTNKKNVAILGASDNKDRYSYKALMLLQAHGYLPVPIHPKLSSIEGIRTFSSLGDLLDKKILIDTLTIYVNPSISDHLIDDIVALCPRRVIFNPGTENVQLEHALELHGIAYEKACTLVLLKTGQF